MGRKNISSAFRWVAGFLISHSSYMHVQGKYLWLPGSRRNCSFPAESAKVIFEIGLPILVVTAFL